MRKVLQLFKKCTFNQIHSSSLKKLFTVNLRSKFILSVLLPIFILFTSYSYITYRTSEENMRKNASYEPAKLISKISTNISDYIKDLKNDIDTALFYNQNKESFLTELSKMNPEYNSDIGKSKFEIYKKKAEKYTDYPLVSSMILSRKETLSGIYFFSNNYVYFLGLSYPYILSENTYSNESWYVETRKTRGFNYFSGNWKPSNKRIQENVLSILESVYDSNEENSERNFIGMLRFDISLDYSSFINEDTISDNSCILLTDKNNQPIYMKNNGAPVDNTNLSFLENVKNANAESIPVSLDGKSMIVVKTVSPNIPLNIYYIIPAHEIYKDLYLLRNTSVILTIICILLMLLVSSTISSMLLKPIYKLISAMAEVEKGNFQARVNIKNQDETKYLAASFNQMTENIETLINKVYHAELKQKDAELYSLQSQINPHFLYNTLESIRGVALMHNIESIATMSKSLALLFRYSISKKVLVPLGDELKHLENYFIIQNFRHENKFDLKYDIPDELYQYPILKLTLQPLVENSIKHGLEMKLGKGSIEIRMSKEGNTILAVISDDGEGIPMDLMRELNAELASGISEPNRENASESYSSTGIGVRNVNSRLKLYFGKEYGLRFLESQIGATVEITFPALEWKE